LFFSLVAYGCQLRWAFALLVYLPFGEINIVVDDDDDE